MKRQIFILVLAIFATAATVFGQDAVKGSAPTPLTCVPNAATPIAGQPYDYSAAISPAGGTAFWYATKSTTFTTAGVRQATIIPNDGVALSAAAATPYATAIPSATDPTKVTITWTSAGLAGIDATNNPLFVVVEYAGPTCANNLKVIQVIPKIAFTVDIANMKAPVAPATTPTPLGIGVAESQCFANVASAAFSAGSVNIDYGVNTLYFEVIAANFTGSFKPTLRLAGLQGSQTATIAWGYTPATAGANSVGTGSAPGFDSSQFTALVDPSVTNTSTGVSIYVAVTISNHGFEGLADEPVTLAVDAVDSSNNPDVEPDCVTIASFEDITTSTINLRPTVTTTPTSLPQIPAN